jgi:hypothetical protein
MKYLIKDKHSSLFSPSVKEMEKKFYNFYACSLHEDLSTIRDQFNKTFYGRNLWLQNKLQFCVCKAFPALIMFDGKPRAYPSENTSQVFHTWADF